MPSTYHENSTINGTQPPDPCPHSSSLRGAQRRGNLQYTPSPAPTSAVNGEKFVEICRQKVLDKGIAGFSRPVIPRPTRPVIPRPTRPDPPLGLVDLQSLPPRGWCITCGSEIYRPNADHCTRCRRIEN